VIFAFGAICVNSSEAQPSRIQAHAPSNAIQLPKHQSLTGTIRELFRRFRQHALPSEARSSPESFTIRSCNGFNFREVLLIDGCRFICHLAVTTVCRGRIRVFVIERRQVKRKRQEMAT
jgi:hypothetical protein